ncbi:MAG: enoyl-CoA hydratase/isomerase family protein [Rhodospirillales bacterium]|nr:enoyl-CoA hydratase/isomerase family protein [Rhodospirillales bacterium]
MTEPLITAEIDARQIATISLNRAEVHNAMNAPMLTAISDAIGEFEQNPDIRVLVFRANGKNFSAGADMSPGSEGDDAKSPAPSLPAAIEKLASFTRPTVAMVQGACIGGGVAWITACDIVVASDDAFFSIPEVRLGFNPASLIPMFLNAIGTRNTLRYVLGGDKFDAGKAYEIGLVHHLCAPQSLDETVAPIIDALLDGGTNALVAAKQTILELTGLIVPDDLAARLNAVGEESRATDEATEGRASFREKRPAKWVGPR